MDGVSQRRRRTPQQPSGKRGSRHRQHRRHKPRGDHISKPLHRRAAALRLGHPRGDLREQGLAADPPRLDNQRARAVQRRADDPVAGRLRHRRGLAGEERLVHRALALHHHAVDRRFLARADAHPLADPDVADRHLALDAAGLNSPRGVGREAEQGGDGRAGAAAGAQLQHLPQQRQGDDDRGRLKINRHRHRSRRATQRRREEPRREGRGHAV